MSRIRHVRVLHGRLDARVVLRKHLFTRRRRRARVSAGFGGGFRPGFFFRDDVAERVARVVVRRFVAHAVVLAGDLLHRRRRRVLKVRVRIRRGALRQPLRERRLRRGAPRRARRRETRVARRRRDPSQRRIAESLGRLEGGVRARLRRRRVALRHLRRRRRLEELLAVLLGEALFLRSRRSKGRRLRRLRSGESLGGGFPSRSRALRGAAAREGEARRGGHGVPSVPLGASLGVSGVSVRHRHRAGHLAVLLAAGHERGGRHEHLRARVVGLRPLGGALRVRLRNVRLRNVRLRRSTVRRLSVRRSSLRPRVCLCLRTQTREALLLLSPGRGGGFSLRQPGRLCLRPRLLLLSRGGEAAVRDRALRAYRRASSPHLSRSSVPWSSSRSVNTHRPSEMSSST